MSDVQIDANDIVNNLLEQVAVLSRDNAFLKAQITALTKPKEDEDASDTV
jgi:hypothetical protein